MSQGDPGRYTDYTAILRLVKEDFKFLREHWFMGRVETLPPSRFSQHNSNGLYDYSPFLFGTSLMEGLEIAYGFAMALWDIIVEPC